MGALETAIEGLLGRSVETRAAWFRNSVESERRGRRVGLAAQRDLERRARARGALDPDGPAHRLQKLTRDPEPQPEASVTAGVRCAAEPLKDHLLLFEREPDAVVPHAHRRPGAIA